MLSLSQSPPLLFKCLMSLFCGLQWNVSSAALQFDNAVLLSEMSILFSNRENVRQYTVPHLFVAASKASTHTVCGQDRAVRGLKERAVIKFVFADSQVFSKTDKKRSLTGLFLQTSL